MPEHTNARAPEFTSSLPRTVEESMQLNANGSNEDSVILTYLNPLLSLR